MTTHAPDPLNAVLEGLRSRMMVDPAIRERLVSLLWIGSAARDQDVHDNSDLDIQVILDRPDTAAMRALAIAFENHPLVDLSIIHLSDIVTNDGYQVFQDGTKGAFFVHVLAAGVLLYGDDVYGRLAGELPLDAVRTSLVFTIREYLARLRVMVVLRPESPFSFKKYTVKLLRDVLTYSEHLPLARLAHTSNQDIVELAADAWPMLAEGLPNFGELADFSTHLSSAQQFEILKRLEQLVADAVMSTVLGPD